MLNFRTISSVLGIMIGIAALTASFNFSQTAKNEILKNIEGMDSQLVFIKNENLQISSESEPHKPILPLAIDDADTLYKECSEIEALSPIVSANIVINDSAFLNQTYKVLSIWPDLYEVLDIELREGNFISEYDNMEIKRVCVIGEDIYNQLYKNSHAVGRYLDIFNSKFLIIGVISKSDKNNTIDTGKSIFIPYNTFKKFHDLKETIEAIAIRRKPDEQVNNLTSKIENIMERKGRRNLKITDQSLFIEKKIKTVKSIEVIVNSIPLIILIISCISCSNILIISVNERTNEIGLRIALGATKMEILKMFVLEGFYLIFSGGILGMIAGYFLTQLLLKQLPSMIEGYQTWTFFYSWSTALRSTLILVICGFLSSIIPAYRAANLDPTQALRYE